MSEKIKTCKNCAYRQIGQCGLSGFSCSIERRHPTVCGRDFTGWKEKKSIVSKIKCLFKT